MDIEDKNRPVSTGVVPPTGSDRPALDANDLPDLDEDPACEDGRTEVASDASFPASDPSATAQPGMTGDPVPSSGFREEDERV